MIEKRLTLNQEKSICLVWGIKQQKKRIKEELEEKPLMCGSVMISMVKYDKWLGDILHCDGLAESVLETIKQREGKVKGAALEIVDIVDDWRARVVGGLQSGLFFWESCCKPSLLYNAGRWVDMSKEEEKRLDFLQIWFLRMLLRQGQGVPSGAILWEVAALSMGRRVWQEKLCVSLHIARLSKDILARKVWEEQQLFQWPGLAAEAEEIASELGVESVMDTRLNKKDYRDMFTEACHKYDEVMLRDKMENKIKCAKIMKEEYGRKNYFSKLIPGEVKEYFATRVQMLPLAGNFSKDNRFRPTVWLFLCGAWEEQEHIRQHCPKYDNIREKYGNLTNDDSLVQFYRDVLDRRDKVREEEEQ